MWIQPKVEIKILSELQPIKTHTCLTGSCTVSEGKSAYLYSRLYMYRTGNGRVPRMRSRLWRALHWNASEEGTLIVTPTTKEKSMRKIVLENQTSWSNSVTVIHEIKTLVYHGFTCNMTLIINNLVVITRRAAKSNKRFRNMRCHIKEILHYILHYVILYYIILHRHITLYTTTQTYYIIYYITLYNTDILSSLFWVCIPFGVWGDV